MYFRVQSIISWVILAIKFSSRTYRHFPKIVKACFRYPKTCKTSKIESLEILQKRCFLTICIEKGKDNIAAPPRKLFQQKLHQNHLFPYKCHACKTLCDSMQLKLRSGIPKNSGKVEQRHLWNVFHPKLIDRHQFM